MRFYHLIIPHPYSAITFISMLEASSERMLSRFMDDFFDGRLLYHMLLVTMTLAFCMSWEMPPPETKLDVMLYESAFYLAVSNLLSVMFLTTVHIPFQLVTKINLRAFAAANWKVFIFQTTLDTYCCLRRFFIFNSLV